MPKHCLTCDNYDASEQSATWCHVSTRLYERPDVREWVDSTNHIPMTQAALDVYTSVRGPCPAWRRKETP